MKKDNLFEENSEIGDFDFGEKTADVFDDMLDRSVPLYKELQRMIGEIAADFAVDGTNIYDLGCSTGITMNTLYNAIDKNVKFIGLDYSQAMITKCRERFNKI